jgi:WD40 repeat protein
VPKALDCPEPEVLQTFLLGQFAREEVDRLAAHVEHCAHCVETLHGLHCRDDLVDAIRAPVEPRDEAFTAVLETLIARLCELPTPRGENLPTSGNRGQADGGEAEVTQDIYDFLAPAQQPDEIGRLGAYRVLKVLGIGGMGVVFQAEDPKLERQVALKVLRPRLLEDGAARQRFLREARAAAGLTHDHVVTVLHIAEDRGVPFLAMPLLEGETLEARLRRETRLPVADVLRLGGEIAGGLAAAHARGVIHRDVKPSNIWLEKPAARVKLLDFGLARVVGDEGGLTHSGVVVGTPAYMAPEQARGEAADARCDLFGLGCVLYRMVTGEAPFRGGTTMATLRELELHEPPPSHLRNPAVPRTLSDLVKRLLSKDRAERPSSAACVVAELADIDPARDCALPRSRGFISRRVAALAVLLLFLGPLAYLAAPAVIRIATNQGELVIETDQEVRITLKQDGQPVRILEVKSGRAFDVKAGTYRAEIVEVPDGIRVTTDNFSLSRGGRQVLAVRLELAKGKPPPAQPPVATGPWPIDALRREDIPKYELAVAGGGDPEKAPAGLVAILGDSRLKHWNGVHSVAFSRDGKMLASASYDRTVKLWDPDSGKELRALRGHQSEVQSAAFRADGRLLVTASADGVVKLWDPATGRETGTLVVKHKGRINEIALSGDGKTLASAGWEDHTVKLWETETAKELYSLDAGPKRVHRVTFRPDGRVVAAANHDGTVRLWEVGTGKLIRNLAVAKNEICAVAFSPNAKLLATGGENGTVYVWDTATWQRVHTLTAPGNQIHSLAFRADNRWLAAGERWDGVIRLWDVVTGAEMRTLRGNFGNVSSLAFRADSPVLAAADLGHNIKLWDTDAGKELLPSTGHYSYVDAVAFHPNGRWLASAGPDRTVKIWDVAAAAELHTLRGHRDPVRSLAFRPDGDVLASGSLDGAVKLWQSGTWKARTLAGHHKVTSVAFTRDSRLLAAGTAAGTVRIWDAASLKEMDTLHDHLDWLGLVAFSPDGQQLAFGRHDGTLKIWEPHTALEICALPGHRAEIHSVAFRGDGRILASSSHDRTVKLWDLATRKELQTLTGHQDQINFVAFLGDSPTFATASHDGTVRLWDSEKRKETSIVRLAPPGGGIFKLAFSPDGRHLATANGNGTVYIIRLAPLPTAKAPR